MPTHDRWDVARMIGDCLPREFPHYVINRLKGALSNLKGILSLILKYNLGALNDGHIWLVEAILHEHAGALVPTGDISCLGHGNFRPIDHFRENNDSPVPILSLNFRAGSRIGEFWYEGEMQASTLKTYALRDQWSKQEIATYLEFQGRHYELTWGQIYNILRDHRELRTKVLVFVVRDSQGATQTVTCKWLPSHGWTIWLDDPSSIDPSAVVISR